MMGLRDSSRSWSRSTEVSQETLQAPQFLPPKHKPSLPRRNLDGCIPLDACFYEPHHRPIPKLVIDGTDRPPDCAAPAFRSHREQQRRSVPIGICPLRRELRQRSIGAPSRGMVRAPMARIVIPVASPRSIGPRGSLREQVMGLLQELPFDRLHHAPSPEMRAAGLTPPLCTGPAVPCHAPLTVPQA